MQFSLVISRCNIKFSVFWLSQGNAATLNREVGKIHTTTCIPFILRSYLWPTNSPNSAQLQATVYHSPKFKHPVPCSTVGMRRGTVTRTAVTTIHVAYRLRLTQNVTMILHRRRLLTTYVKQLFPTIARKISSHAVYGVGVDNGGHNDCTTPNHGIFFIKDGVVVQCTIRRVYWTIAATRQIAKEF